MKLLFAFIFILTVTFSQSQTGIKGVLHNTDSSKVELAYAAMFNKADTSLAKVETTNENGEFFIANLKPGQYFLKATFVGLPNLIVDNIELKENEIKDMGDLYFVMESLEEVVITAERSIIEVKPDRTVFNVQGTINSTGSNALNLLRKAPSVNVDNNDNISVLGRSGVRLYIDGKQLPLSGDDLSNYLKSLPADQIDRIEIITTPGAKYDAEGNAGIIDIRLKKDKNMGANGSLSGTFTQGILTRYNVNASGNYRNKKMNIFGAAGYNVNDNFHNINFQSYQNGFYMDEINNTENDRSIYSYRLGTDFFLNKKSTIGFLVDGGATAGQEISFNQIKISDDTNISQVDSMLIARNTGVSQRQRNTFNVNYSFIGDKRQTLNIDLNYGRYINKKERHQPNTYYNSTEDTIYSQIINNFNTPIDIDIYTGKIDYETTFKEGKLGFGAKYSRVGTKNTFEVYDFVNEVDVLDASRSNKFNYDENVYAAYLSYSRKLGEKWSFVSGLRAELTDAKGDLITFDTSLQEPPIYLNYFNLFPSAGLTWNAKPKHSWSLNYGRRINRPDYNVLNPFRNQLSELSIEKGNPFLKPEIVNNAELGYTFAYMYNFKIGYSKTLNKITRLIGPDETNPQASFISWDNLATQSVWSLNASIPHKFTKWWRAFFNVSMSYINNQANYGGDAIVDVQTLSYMIYQQHTFNLFKGYKAELSGYYSGPGVWGGTFVYGANWSVGAGLQKSYFKKKLKVRLNVNNIFNRIGWYGSSSFNGLVSTGNGMWDSRYVSLSLNYNFGNSNVKSRKHKTGADSELNRIK